MSKENLARLVEQLRDEVDTLPAEDEAAKHRIEGIISRLDSTLESEESASGISASIQETIHEMEARHPDATTVLNNILMTLANMGI